MKLIITKKLFYIITLGILISNCVLISTQVEREEISREVIEAPHQRKKESSLLNLKFIKEENDKLVFDVSNEKKIDTYNESQYNILYHCNKKIKRNKSGEWYFIAAGIAWVYEGQGNSNYFKNLFFHSLLSLGIGAVIAVGDWVSLPFRLGEYKEKKPKKFSKFLKTEKSKDIVPDNEIYFLFSNNKEVPINNGKISLDKKFFFNKNTLLYKNKTNFKYNWLNRNLKRSYLRQEISKIFESEENYYSIYIKYLKGDSEKIKNNLTGFIRIGNKKYLEELLESGIDLNYSEKSRYPPLHTAILLGNYEIVKLLLNKKADPKFKNYRGKTGIDLAEEKLKKSKLASKKIEYQKILDLLKQYSK